MHQVRGICWLLDDPPYDERDERPLQDNAEFHCRLPGSADCSIMPVPFILERISAWMRLLIQAGTTLAMPVRQQVCPLLADVTHEPVGECADLARQYAAGARSREAATPASPAAVCSYRGDA